MLHYAEGIHTFRKTKERIIFAAVFRRNLFL